MAYRTKTYLAGDWTGDKNLIDELHKWNDSKHWNLHFVDAHKEIQARDDSLFCTVKKSLSERLNMSKTFVLVVGSGTLRLTKGSCRYCKSYDSYHKSCHRGYSVDYRSYIDYECEKAKSDISKIVVIYNYASVDRSKCPTSLRYTGTHIPGYYFENGQAYWNYSAIRDAIMD